MSDGLIRSYARRAVGFDCLSFDVFDTLVLRPLRSPTDVFQLVRAKLIATSTALHYPAEIDALPELRMEAETLARREKETRTGCSEVSIDEIYARFAARTSIDLRSCNAIRSLEWDTELELAYPSPTGMELFRHAQSTGKQIVLCSDMYMSSAQIRVLLVKAGYTVLAPIYVSCEHARSKHLGTLFGHVARMSGFSTSQILHVGDNLHSDVLMAEAAGCGAIHLPSPSIAQSVLQLWPTEHRHEGLVHSIVGGIVRKNRDLLAQADPWHTLGFNVFGPLFIGFAIWLRSAVERHRPDRVALFARDTHWLLPLLHRLTTDLATKPSIEYVYASRASLFMPSMIDFPLSRLVHLFSGKSLRSVENHLCRLGFDATALSGAIRSAAFTSSDEIVENGDPRMQHLLATMHKALLHEGLKRRPMAEEYLSKFAENADTVFLVDIGWVGNIQASFVRLLRTRHPRTRFVGHYVGIFNSAVDNAIAGHPMHGWLERPDGLSEVEQSMWWSGGVELLEFAMRAPHGSTLGYEDNGSGEVVPVLENSFEEDIETGFSVRLQGGALAFAEDFLATFGTAPIPGLDSRAWGSSFSRLVMDPTPAEAELLGDLTHSDAAGESGQRLPLAPKLLDKAERSAGFALAYWPYGFIARNELSDDDAFDEAVYLQLNPDVRAAVRRGEYENGKEHWLRHGQREARRSSWVTWARRKREEGG